MGWVERYNGAVAFRLVRETHQAHAARIGKRWVPPVKSDTRPISLLNPSYDQAS
jgi:hypothetical protein